MRFIFQNVQNLLTLDNIFCFIFQIVSLVHMEQVVYNTVVIVRTMLHVI